MSETQIAALLRYDSPPETPSQAPQMILSNEPRKNNDQNETYNSFFVNDREELPFDMQSQVDFPTIYNNNTYEENISPIISLSSFGSQTGVNENSTLIFSQNSDCITLSSCEKTTNISNDERTTKSKTNKPAEKNIGDDFQELDDILKSIDFESFSGETPLNINTASKSQKKYQSELEVTNCVSISNDKIIASCPVPIQNINSLKPSNVNEFRKVKNLCETHDLECYKENFISIKTCPLNEKTTIDFESVDEGEKSDTHSNKVPMNLTIKTEVLLKTNNTSLIPFSIKRLYDIVRADFSDFAFIYALSSQLCQDRVPMECFVTLKMVLLLSLSSIGNDPDRPPLPVVAMADDTYMTDYLMVNIGKLATRFVGPMGVVKPSLSNKNWIEADPILLARGGVYYVGDWNRLNLKRAESIFKTIECSNVPVNNSTACYPLETSIWTHWHSFKYNSKDQQTFNKFLKIFGIPVFVSDDSHETLVDYTLEQSSIRIFESTIDHLSVNEDDMRNFLVYVSQSNVNLTPEAASLLKKYFVASRSFRQDCLTKQSYVTLKQFAESFCKLSMRNDVSIDDVLAAIVLCEHSVQNIFSSCSKPPPYFGSFPFVGAVDNYLIEFKQWLDSYLNNFEK